MSPHVTNTPEMKDFRRTLRKHGTPAEASLWSRLKRRQVGGLLFRRQFSIEHFILDFYCPELHLALELDGEGHNHTIEEDRQRDRYLLEHYGIRTLRYENRHVFERPQQIINDILEMSYSSTAAPWFTGPASVEDPNSSPNLGEGDRPEGVVEE